MKKGDEKNFDTLSEKPKKRTKNDSVGRDGGGYLFVSVTIVTAVATACNVSDVVMDTQCILHFTYDTVSN